MSIVSWIRSVLSGMFETEIEKTFDVDVESCTLMDVKVDEWLSTYQGRPKWVDAEQRIRTIKFAGTICSETARLATLALGITVDGGERAKWLQEQCDEIIMPRLRDWIEYAAAVGTVILKPTDKGVDMFLPGQFRIIQHDNGMISDIVFQDSYSEGNGSRKRYYTKLERHSYMSADVRYSEDSESKAVTYYHIENRAFMSHTESSLGKEISLQETKWAGLEPDVYITKQNDEKINTMLFGVIKMPAANDVELDSPLGVSIFANAMEELKDLDIAYSRNAGEIADSESIILADDRLLNLTGQKIGSKPHIKLPHYVHNVYGADTKEFYQEIDRTLKTEQRIAGINNQLSFIGYKCGYSNGYFVFDQKTGMVTATQVEADDRRTIQLIKDIRDKVQKALDDTLYAMSVFADLYNLAPIGTYKVNYAFGDITYNYEEDRNRNYQLAQSGYIPKWLYLVRFEGYSEEEAKALVAEAEKETQKTGLFEE